MPFKTFCSSNFYFAKCKNSLKAKTTYYSSTVLQNPKKAQFREVAMFATKISINIFGEKKFKQSSPKWARRLKTKFQKPSILSFEVICATKLYLSLCNFWSKKSPLWLSRLQCQILAPEQI